MSPGLLRYTSFPTGSVRTTASGGQSHSEVIEPSSAYSTAPCGGDRCRGGRVRVSEFGAKLFRQCPLGYYLSASFSGFWLPPDTSPAVAFVEPLVREKLIGQKLKQVGTDQAAWLPVVVRSWTSVRLEYSVAHYTYSSRGFDYAAAYSFNDDAMCGQRTFTTHS
ncbi:hypothetical protein ACJJTC_004583, partial [Scirpophaga incertulas]